jgi:hypothetical protein
MGTSNSSYPPVHYDTYGHKKPIAPSPLLPCIALANSPSSTVGIGPLAASGTGGAGAGATTSYNGGTGTGASAVDTLNTVPNDSRGQFILTTAGTPVAGLIAQVNFTEPYTGPVNVVPGCVDITASPNVAIAVGAVLSATAPGATTGFQIVSTGTALTTAHAYLITYNVEP